MYWKIESTPCERGLDELNLQPAGRFVLHRHTDEAGVHLDLRLESGDCLLGWRIAADSLEGEPWATEKGKHPLRWLDEDGDAIRIDAGRYGWEFQSHDGGTLILESGSGRKRLRVSRVPDLPLNALRSLVETLEERGATIEQAAQLANDGITARDRAAARLCGLGRELDGEAFDETVWRKTLRGLSLDEIHAQLRGFEVRFDQKYPAQPVSRPEKLNGENANRAQRAMEILRT